MTVTSPRFTSVDYERLPEGFPAELIDGTLVKEPSPTPWHQDLVLHLGQLLRSVVGRGRVLVSPIDVFIDDHNVLQPDVLALDAKRAVRPEDARVALPLLVVEVLSPATARWDRDVKTTIYLGAGVREVWLVDPASKAIEIRSRTGCETVGTGARAVSRAVPGLEVEAADLFAAPGS
ncbi:MAG: Uma2 family endonuclease [Planctomycetota bacterium]